MTGRPSLVEIYALSDPDTGAVRYIGKAVDARKRLAGHMREVRRKSPLYSWLGKLRAEGRVPVLSIIETCEDADWRERERFHIAAARAAGVVLNLADGGDEPGCPPEVRAANGRLVAKLRPPNIMRAYRMCEYQARMAAKWFPHKLERMRQTKEIFRAAVERHRAAGTLAEFDERARLRFFADKPVERWD